MMIRLTLNAKTDPEIHLFNKPIISLGSDPDSVDLHLSGIAIAPIHLNIIEQDGFRIIINLTNDPFVSVNGTPFGKKLLNSGDVIIVHETIILYEKLITAGSNNSLNPQEPTAPLTEISTASKKFQSQPFTPSFQPSSFPLPFEDEITNLMESDFGKSSSHQYVQENSLLDEELTSTADPMQKNSKKAPHVNKAKKSLKDDYLHHLEEGQPSQETMGNDPDERTHLYYAWKWILVFIFSLITIVTVLGVIVYLNVNDKSEAQETKAAQAVADIAMALTYAEINQLKPQNQNWADAEFLKGLLQGILPNTSSYASQIDAQGQFNLCSYSLRIYTNSDLSHFLLIAQPAHSFLQWFVPKKVIVVDSKLMELRTLNDVTSLNRLLASPDPLEGLNGNEILGLVKQGPLIRLSSLAKTVGYLDFVPPKNLAWILPQAENLIYNAPRYWRLGKSLVDEALNLSTSRGSSQEVAKLKSNVEAFAHLPHLVLYSEQGKKSALLTKEGLMMFAPTDNFLYGFIGFNAHGQVNQSTLLKDDDVKETVIATSIKGGDVSRNNSEELAYDSTPLDLTKSHQIDRANVDHNHPIFIQLQSVSISRENALKPLVSALFALINHELQSPDPQFQTEFQHLSHSFLMLDAKQKEIVKENIDYLFHKYDDIPIDQFIGFLKELNLQHLIQQDEDTISLIDENSQQNMGSLISQIEKSTSLIELDNLVHNASTYLNFDCIKDPQEMIAFRNKLRNQLLIQLAKFILCPEDHLSFKTDDRPILEHILYQERLVKPEEREFFIFEFENALPNPNLAEEEL